MYIIHKDNILFVLKQFVTGCFDYDTSEYISDEEILLIWNTNNFLSDDKYEVDDDIIKDFLNKVTVEITHKVMFLLDKNGEGKLCWDIKTESLILVRK